MPPTVTSRKPVNSHFNFDVKEVFDLRESNHRMRRFQKEKKSGQVEGASVHAGLSDLHIKVFLNLKWCHHLFIHSKMEVILASKGILYVIPRTLGSANHWCARYTRNSSTSAHATKYTPTSSPHPPRNINTLRNCRTRIIGTPCVHHFVPKTIYSLSCRNKLQIIV